VTSQEWWRRRPWAVQLSTKRSFLWPTTVSGTLQMPASDLPVVPIGIAQRREPVWFGKSLAAWIAVSAGIVSAIQDPPLATRAADQPLAMSPGERSRQAVPATRARIRSAAAVCQSAPFPCPGTRTKRNGIDQRSSERVQSASGIISSPK
jgi:hypothetical protein